MHHDPQEIHTSQNNEYFMMNEQKLYIAQAFCTAHKEAREEIELYFMHGGESDSG